MCEEEEIRRYKGNIKERSVTFTYHNKVQKYHFVHASETFFYNFYCFKYKILKCFCIFQFYTLVCAIHKNKWICFLVQNSKNPISRAWGCSLRRRICNDHHLKLYIFIPNFLFLIFVIPHVVPLPKQSFLEQAKVSTAARWPSRQKDIAWSFVLMAFWYLSLCFFILYI